MNMKEKDELDCYGHTGTENAMRLGKPIPFKQ